MVTTIQLDEEVKKKLEMMKIHPRETYNEVIKRLIESSEEEFDVQTIKNIEKALEDVKKNRVYTTKEVKRKLGLK